MDRARTSGRVTLIKQEDHFWVVGPSHCRPVVASNLADASVIASYRLREEASIGRKANGHKAEVELAHFSAVEIASAAKQLNVGLTKQGFSQDVLAVAYQEGSGTPRVSPKNYFLARSRITSIENSVVLNRVNRIAVNLEIPAKWSEWKPAVVRYEIQFGPKVSQTQAVHIIEAVKIRMKNLFGHPAQDMSTLNDNPVYLLHQEMRRLKKTHRLDVKTSVQAAADDWTYVLRITLPTAPSSEPTSPASTST